MTRTECRKVCRRIGDTGRYALRWMRADVFAVMDALLAIQDSADRLAVRADIVAYCRRQGIACNPRQTA
jgi:hypothetical protein